MKRSVLGFSCSLASAKNDLASMSVTLWRKTKEWTWENYLKRWYPRVVYPRCLFAYVGKTMYLKRSVLWIAFLPLPLFGIHTIVRNAAIDTESGTGC